MALPSVTYTLSNGNVIDASQLNANFTDLINGATDGTKSYTIDALTTNGSVILGQTSADDVTYNGSLASTIPVKTNNSFDIGSATLGLAGIYLGTAGPRTTRLVGSATSSYTLTFPPTGGTTGMTAITNGSGTLSFRYIEKTAAQSSTVTVTGDETVELCNAASAAFTVTLPNVSTYNGKHYYVKKIDSSANAVTISSADNIEGAATKQLSTQYECLKLVSDGTTWHILERHIHSKWTSYTPSGSWTDNTPVYTGYWRRVGENMEVQIKLVLGGIPQDIALTIDLPSGYTIDTTKGNSPTTLVKVVGTAGAQDTSASQPYEFVVTYSDTNSLHVGYVSSTTATISPLSRTTPFTWANTDQIHLQVSVPISGWDV